jgi:hypothetical protein
MTRSHRRTPITGNTKCESEKRDKTLARKALRRATHVAIQTGMEPPTAHEVTDPYDWGKDGKKYWGRRFPEYMRK